MPDYGMCFLYSQISYSTTVDIEATTEKMSLHSFGQYYYATVAEARAHVNIDFLQVMDHNLRHHNAL